MNLSLKAPILSALDKRVLSLGQLKTELRVNGVQCSFSELKEVLLKLERDRFIQRRSRGRWTK
jgi:hypothetical protein